MFFASFLFSIIPLTILIALVVLAVRAIWLGVVPPRRCVKEASCEKCKYPVAGLSTLTCPECGANLLQSGVITRPMEMQRRGGTARAIAGTLFLIALLTTVALIAIDIAMPVRMGLMSGSVVTTSVNIVPNSSAYASIDIELTLGQANGSAGRSAVLKLNTPGAVTELQLQYGGAFTHKIVDSTGSTIGSGPISHRAMTNWMTAGGVDTSLPSVQQEIRELFTYFSSRSVNLGMGPTVTDLPSFVFGAPAMWSTPTTTSVRAPYTMFWYFALNVVVLATGLVLFGLAVYFIIRRRRKLLRDAEHIAPPRAPSPV